MMMEMCFSKQWQWQDCLAQTTTAAAATKTE
jgi:hypothetical protein